MTDLINEILQTLRNNKLRTALTGLAVSWGVFMLIVLLGVARGVNNSFEDRLQRSSPARMNLYGGSTARPYHGNREGRRIRMEMSDIELLEKEHPGFVKNVTSSVYLSSANLSSGRHSVSTSVEGIFPEGLSRGYTISEGRIFNEHDMNTKSKVMVIPVDYAEQLFPPAGQGALGARVSYNGLSFIIVGIYKSDWSRDVFIPFTTAMGMTSQKDRLGSLTINLKNLTNEQEALEAEQAIRATMARKKDFDPTDPSALWIFNMLANSFQGAKVMGILGMAMWILGLLTLLTGVVGISNIMFVSVRERTHEIGIRRAIGAKPRSVLTQVIAEAVAITLLFGYIGIVLGMAVTQLIAHLTSNTDVLLNPTVNISIAIEVTVVLVAAGALAGLFPALRALKVKPVEALRDE